MRVLASRLVISADWSVCDSVWVSITVALVAGVTMMLSVRMRELPP
jgi:hypothetical protein